MRVWLAIAAINGFLAVALGAFAAHGMQDGFTSDARQVFETGARYHMYHALAMGLSAFAMRGKARIAAQWSAAFFFAGILLFSGSLYLFALSTLHALVFVTPVGGVSFLIGWAALAIAAARLGPSEEN